MKIFATLRLKAQSLKAGKVQAATKLSSGWSTGNGEDFGLIDTKILFVENTATNDVAVLFLDPDEGLLFQVIDGESEDEQYIVGLNVLNPKVITNVIAKLANFRMKNLPTVKELSWLYK